MAVGEQIARRADLDRVAGVGHRRSERRGEPSYQRKYQYYYLVGWSGRSLAVAVIGSHAGYSARTLGWLRPIGSVDHAYDTQQQLRVQAEQRG